MAAVTIIAAWVVVVAGVALAMHLFFRRYVPAVLATGVVAVGLLLLVSVPGRWTWEAIVGVALAAAVAMAISALIGWPLAIARKRKADAVRGFAVLPPDRH